MILSGNNIKVEIPLRSDLGDLLYIGSSRGRHDRFTFEVVHCFEVLRFFRYEAVGGDEMCDGERNLFLSFKIICCRAALEIDSAVGDEWNAGSRSNWIEFDFELLHFQF